MVRYEASATTLTWGVGLLVAGVVGFFAGQFASVQRVLAGYGDMGEPALTVTVVSGLAAVVGFVMTLVGVWSAATNIDTAARALLDAAAVADRAEAERREEESRAARKALEEFRARASAAADGAAGTGPSPTAGTGLSPRS
jgi:hypothetical protein